MRKKIIRILIMMLILLVCIGVVSAEDNTTQLLSDNQTTQINNEKTFEDIQIAIDNAKENDTIELEGTYNGNGAINVNKSVTLYSKNGATLDGMNMTNIFNIENVRISLVNLNIINSDSQFTSAIYSNGNLTVMNCQFINNMGRDTAGAIYSANNLKIINSTFTDNFVRKENYIFDDDYITKESIIIGGSIFSDGQLEIYNSTFNFASNIIAYGDELKILNSNIILTVIKPYAKKNIITNSILNDSEIDLDYMNLTLEKCNIINAINHPVIFKSQLIDNINTIIINQCNFINNSYEPCSYSYQGIIDLDYSDIYVYNSLFENNDRNIFDAHFGKLYICNSSFSNHECPGLKGLIDCDNITLINSTFTNNTSKFAGAIYAKELYLENCNFTNTQQAAIYSSKFSSVNGKEYTKTTSFNNSLKPCEIITANMGKLSTVYQSGEKIKITFNCANRTLFDGQICTILTKDKKIYYFDDVVYFGKKNYFNPNNLPVGKYKISITYEGQPISLKSSTFKITKANTIIKAPKVTNKYKKSKYFKVTVKHKTTKKPVKKTYVKIKVDKKIYNVKTDSKGIAKFNTKKLKIGKHKVVITSGNSNYQMSCKSTITIKR